MKMPFVPFKFLTSLYFIYTPMYLAQDRPGVQIQVSWTALFILTQFSGNGRTENITLLFFLIGLLLIQTVHAMSEHLLIHNAASDNILLALLML